MIEFKGIEFDRNFARNVQNYFGGVQRYIDTETVRLMEPYTPKKTGHQIDIGATGTHPGSGVVQYNSGIAKRNYYTNKGLGKEGMHAKKNKGLRGRYWFARMKADHKDTILKGARKYR